MLDLLGKNAAEEKNREKTFSIRGVGEQADVQLERLEQTLKGYAPGGCKRLMAAPKTKMAEEMLLNTDFVRAVEEELFDIRRNYELYKETIKNGIENETSRQSAGETPEMSGKEINQKEASKKQSDGFDYIDEKGKQDWDHPVVQAAGAILAQKIEEDFFNIDELYKDDRHSILDCFEILRHIDENHFAVRVAEEYLRNKIRTSDEKLFASIAKLASVRGEDHFFVRTAVKVLKEEMEEELAERGVQGDVFAAVSRLAEKDEGHFLVRAGREVVAERIIGEIETAEQNVISERINEPDFNPVSVSSDSIADYIWNLYCALLSEYENEQKLRAEQQAQAQTGEPEPNNSVLAENIHAAVPVVDRTPRITYSEFLSSLRLKNSKCKGIVIIPALLTLAKLPKERSDDPLEKFLDSAFKLAVEEMNKTRPAIGLPVYDRLHEKEITVAKKQIDLKA